MKEFMAYVGTLKTIIDRYYEKEILFYTQDCVWYSRYHSREMSVEEVVEWVLEITAPNDED